MNKRIACITLFLVLSALVFNVWRGTTQSTGEQQASARAREQANRLLRSSKAKYLSISVRNALNLVVNPPDEGTRARATVRSQPQGEILLPIYDDHEALVNDPRKDLLNIDFTTQNDPAVASFNDTVVVAYSDSGEFLETGSGVGYSRSTDGGRTFVDMGNIPAPSPPSGQSFGSSGLVVDKAGNYYASLPAFDPSGARPPGFEFSIEVSKSTDGGVTFQPPVLLPPTPAGPDSFAFKPFIAVDNSNNTATTGNVYVSYTEVSQSFPGTPIAFSRSTNGGASFSTPIILSPVSDIAEAAEPVVGKNGEIYVSWIRIFSTSAPDEPSAIFVAKSTDGGQSFGAPMAIANLAQIGFKTANLSGGFPVYSDPRIDVSPVDGTIYIVFASNPPGPDGADVFLTRSVNGGAAWSAPKKINSDSDAHEFFPDVAVNREGTVQVVYYKERMLQLLGFTAEQISVYRVTSSDGGRSFSCERKVTLGSFTPAIGCDLSFFFPYMGRYIDIKAGVTTNGLGRSFLMAWGDCRRIITGESGSRNDQDVVFSIDR